MAILAGLGLVAAAVVNPLRPLVFDMCVFHRVTGLPCQTCGLTRAVCLAVRGRWAESLAYHPAGPLVACALVVVGAWAAAEWFRGRALAEGVRRRAVAAVIVAGAGVSIVTWVARLVTGRFFV